MIDPAMAHIECNRCHGNLVAEWKLEEIKKLLDQPTLDSDQLLDDIYDIIQTSLRYEPI